SGRNGTSFLNHSSTWRVASDLTVTLPSLSTRAAPWLRNTGSTQLTESLVTPSGRPKGKPALWHFSAAARKKSHVHLSASSLSGGAPAGYILVSSSPTCCLKRSMRPTHGKVGLPTGAGTPTQWPFCLPTASTLSLTLPFAAISAVIRSSTGSKLSAWAGASHVRKVNISCPDFAIASAA